MTGTLEWTCKKQPKKYDVEIEEWCPERVVFIDCASKKTCKITMTQTKTGKLHSHAKGGVTKRDWAVYVGSMVSSNRIEGIWRREDGVYGGDGDFSLDCHDT